MEQKYWITPRDKLRLLDELLKLLVGEAQISFEGNLSRCNLRGLEEHRISPFGELHRINKEPGSNFVAFALNNESIEAIARKLLNEECALHAIEHIQIQKHGELQVLIGDYFDEECISVGPLISVESLARLLSEGVIVDYMSDSEAKAKYLWFSRDHGNA